MCGNIVVAGEASQVWLVLEVLPHAWRSQVPHVRAQWFVALQVPHLQPWIQQTHQPQEPPLPSHR